MSLSIKTEAASNTHKVLARYRLAPQFPFPCGLLDCLAAYFYLLTVQHPSEIVLAGDSAGGGMVVRYVRLWDKETVADLNAAYL